jgi:HSP20 family molecular chaperone IbpA
LAKTKNIPIKERKDTISKKSDSFRLAFDLPGFKQEEIQVILANSLVYIEAKIEEIGSDGSKSWREFSFECLIPKEVKSVNAFIDSDGLLLIEAEESLPKETITGIKHESGKKSKRKKSD